MILTVTLNAALDVTYIVDNLVPSTSHRVDTVHERAGGKGINVARVLSALGWPAVVTGLSGGDTGDRLRGELRAVGLRDELVPVAGESRRTLTVVSREDGDATVFNQTGPLVTTDEWEAFTAQYARLLRDADVVVLSGSLPPGLPTDAYAHLVALAHEGGVAAILDTSGPALRDALAVGPDVVKPNADELAAVTGRQDIAAAAAGLRAMGARTVVASRGPDGLHAITPRGTWRATPPERLTGNPTGAGDACVAALAAGIATGAPWPAILCEAVALSAAAVLRPTAGDFDTDAYRRFRTTVPVEEVHAARSHP
ncbi:1-phosphofructokinase family hexose kinase [Streptomyces sp. H10-C2]|uniref:1-phosphofructokinase family hexose kinase n=1 Tax=unclassified Streptomyces TaxID=2593676 RepID=UPI0024BAE958|nr:MULTISPECIES: 1-phosphofructokinase family hexose kinase [unclassified Streptomyces]MDJ0344440.1 1-phosphofructokinase family hexose kinase [Streptomyces sp. PH10-H1]MDJ0372084.1 1-phosphofructokinase family hexose kinase [Streptomyces sp. H10-C2]